MDIASNLVAAGNRRVAELGLRNCRFEEGDATYLHRLPDQSFDLVVSIFGAMFAPKPFDVAKEMVRDDFKMSHEQFSLAASRAPAGSDGLVLLPYLEGERTPNVPDGTGVFFGVNNRTFTASHFARATMEGVTLGMNYGLRRRAQLGVTPTQIRATGGGARSKVWRQIMADVFDAEVVTLKVGEGAAYGAALQALWCWKLQQGGREAISEITDEFVEVNKSETAVPNKENAAVYREIQEMQDELSKAVRNVFATHRKFVLRA